MAEGTEGEGSAAEGVTETMLEQAHDIGEATAKLDLLGASHETLKAAHDDLRSTVGFLADRVSELAGTIGTVAEKLEKLEPLKATEDAIEGAEGEGSAAIDAVDPEHATPNPADTGKSFLRRLHDHIS